MAEQTKNNPNQSKTGQGAQAGGKNPPTGGPDQYKPNQPMEGDKKGQNVNQGGQASQDPYPPTNPERPVMGGAQGGGEFKGGQNVQSGQSKSGQNVQGGMGQTQGGQSKGGTQTGATQGHSKGATGGNVGGGAIGSTGAGGLGGSQRTAGGTPSGLEEE